MALMHLNGVYLAAYDLLEIRDQTTRLNRRYIVVHRRLMLLS